MDRMNALLRPDGWDRRVKSLNRMLSDIFYRHGLFCASHPYVALFLSFVLLFFLSSPIVHQLHANLTQTAQAKPMLFWETTSSHAHIHMGGTHAKYGKAPFLRLEQIVINVTNSDDDESPVQGAVGRKLLQYALDLQQKISVSVAEFENASENAKAPALRQYKLSDICYKPHGSDKCLVHSPLEFWASDEARFNADTDYLGTLSNTSVLSSLGIPIPLQSVFGGIQLDSATGYVIGAESLLITYFLNERNTDLTYEETISDIWDKLWEHVLMGHRQAVPTHGLPDPLAWRAEGEPKLLYYEFGRSSSVFTGESLVLGVMYLIVFLYISLVLGKVDLVKSKFALGFGAVVTVFSGLIMSVGLCSMLGVKTSLVPWEALPFLIIVVGVENISVLTNAVVMTSLDLPVKERVGLGLSKVGASMTLSLGGEMVLLLIASTTSIPALQEFCLFAAVSIVMDYFMQITFFITILSIDIRRLELSDLHKLRQIQGDLSGQRLSVTPTYSQTEPEATQAENASSRRPHWGSYLIILLLMLLLGFGLSGSSAPPIMGEKNISSGTADVSNRQLPLMPSLNTAPCENSMCSTADVFWHVIDPDRSAKYVEIRPSTFIVFDMEDSREIHASDGADSTSRPLSEPPKVRWQLSSLRKPSGERRFLTDRHPAVFTVAIVSLLLFCVLLCVLLSGVVLMCTGVKRPFRRTQRRPLSTGFEERACDDDSWKRNCCGSVLTFPTSNGVDVDALSMVDDVVAWSCFQTQVRYVAGSEDFRRRIVRRQTQGRRRGRIKILETYIFAERVLMAIGMDNGSVEVWDLDANCLIIKDTCAGPAVSRIIFGMVGSNLYTFAGKVNGVLSVLQVPLSHNSSMAQKHPFSTILDKHNGTIRDIYLDWRGSLYTASDDSTVHCWKASNSNVGLLEWSVSHVFLGHKCAVKSLACDSAARLLATGCSDGEIFIWDLETRRPLAKIFRGDSDDDDSLRSGHIGAITKLFVTQTQSGINSAKYVICSAGSDERVHFWELTATVKEDVGNGKPMASNRSRSSSAPTAAPRNFAVRRDSFVSREPSILSNRQSPGAGRDSKGDDDRVFPLVELEHLGSLHQTGCTTIALHGWLLAGARTVPILGRATEGKCWTIPGIVRRLWNMIFATGPPLENARMESGGDWVWEVWMTDVRTWKRSHYLETVFIGKDDLRGLGSATTDDLDEKTAVSHSIKKCKSRRHPDNRAKRSGDSLQMPIGTSLCGRAGILTSSDTEEASANQQLSGSQLAIAPQHVNGGGAIRENMPGISGNNEKIDRGPDSARSPDGLLDPNLSLPHDRGTTTSDPVDLQIAVAENTPPPSFLTSTPNRLEPDYAPKYIWSDSESQASSSQSASASSTANEREGSIMPDGTSSEASEDTDRMFQEEQIPVFHIRSISASDAGIAIAFGNSVKVLFFGDDLDEARAPVRPATDDSAANRRSYGWELYDETAEGKLHAA